MRKLRKKLIINKRFNDYLLYALGEIVLVMIGILLALQVDTWNQNRIDRNTEQDAIVSLLEEFKLNKERIERKQEKRINALNMLNIYAQAATSGRVSDSLMQATHTSDLFPGITNPSFGIIKSLISSGEVNLIQNDSLRYLLADWEDQTENLRENEEILWEFTIDYKAFMDNYLLIEGDKWYDGDSFDRESKLLEVQKSIAYRNKLLTLQSVMSITILEAKGTIERLNKIIQLMEGELIK